MIPAAALVRRLPVFAGCSHAEGLHMRFSGRTQQVWDILVEQDRFTSAIEIHRMLSSRGENVGLITVYRSLHALAGAGHVDVLLGPDGHHRYRHCSPAAHHHLLCRECHRAVEIYDSPPGLQDLGFVDDSVRITLVGICDECTAS